MLISAWLTSVRNRFQSSQVPKRRTGRSKIAAESLENLEIRALLTAPTLVAIRPNIGNILQEAEIRHVAPREVTLQFNPGQTIDAATLATGIVVDRGGNDKLINGVGDVPVTIGFVGIGDLPNEVVVRFAENLPDDVYRITIKGAGAGALKNTANEAFNSGVNLARTFTLDLGTVVEGVVPQPILRNKTINIANVAQLKDADKLTISVGGKTKVFEFNNTTLANGFTGDYAVNFTPTTSAATIAANLASQINTAAMGVTAAAAGSNVSLVGSSFTPVIVKTLNAATSVTVADAGLVQRKDTVVVYFNQDPLNPASAQNPAFYRLYNTGGTLTTADDLLLHPTAVTYDVASNSAVLKFASDLPAAIYSLRIGSDTESTDLLSSAIDLGGLTGTVSVEWDGVIGDSNAEANDVDFYKFVLTASQAVSFTATPVAGADLALRLFNSAGTQQGIRNTGGVGVAETLVSGILGAGTYFLGVSSSGNVTYNPATGAGASGGTTTGAYKLTSGNILTPDNNSSFATANKVGVLGATQLTINSQIEPQGVPLPPYPGGTDEPSHRDIPISSENHVGSSGTTPAVPGAIGVVNYYFGDVYGQDPFGNVLHNAITEPQKLLARQIMELWSKKAGFVARETSNSGLQIVTGDLRAASPKIPPNAAAGIAGGGLAIVNGNADYGASEYGGAWFNIAIHEIGHALGLPHAYDAVSVMGSAGGEDPTSTAPGREPIYPTGVDIVNIQRIIPPNATDIDMYQFTLTQEGAFSAETVAERVSSNLDSVLRLYDGNKKLIAQNDNYYSSDSFIGLHLQPGTYYIGVSSTGNADYDPAISDTGFGGTTDGAYQLKLKFDPVATSILVDASGTEFDGDANGEAGGEYEFWFRSANTIVVDKNVAGVGSGTIGAPYSTISDAISAAAVTPGSIIRIVGNGGTDGNDLTAADAKPYLVGTALSGSTQITLADGATLEVPKDTTLMIDASAVIKLMSANIDAGTSAVGVDRSNGAIQILGTPSRSVYLTSYLDDSLGGNSDGVTDPNDLKGGNWGGVVFRDTSDYESQGIFLNHVNKANIKYGGGLVSVNSVTTVYTPIHLDTARPTITYNTITNSAAAAVSANPNSFDDSLNRIGPEIHGNLLTNNSINGLNVRIRTLLGKPIDTLDVNARLDDTDIVHVISENLIITGSAGGPLNGVPRLSGRLAIDPGTVVKLQGSRIENQIGNASIIAEGTAERPITFTSLLDDQFGAGGTFDTTNNQSVAIATPGSWGGIFLGPTSNGSIDHAILRYGGGSTPIEGDSNEFSVIEVYQAAFRLTNSRLEFNASGVGPDGLDASRNGRGANSEATVFVRGAQPTIVGNQFRNNSSQGSFLISIDVNSLNSFEHPDTGRSTGLIERFSQLDDNLGALIRNNLMQNNGINGMEVRGGTLETQVVWDDTDIVHVVRDEIYDPNLQTYGGIRLQSSKTASLVVKLEGPTAGFTAGGTLLEIDDRIGGTVQIVGAPGFPVVLTSLYDDSVGAGFDLNGFPAVDTNNDGIDLHNNSNPTVLTPDGLDDVTGEAFTGTYAGPGDWRSVKLTQYSNDRNVRIVNESEAALTAGRNTNGNPLAAELLGTLAPNDKSGDDNRPVGFEVHGQISPDTPADVDTYSFKADAGTEVWIDLDRTSSHLDSVLELVLSTGAVIATSDNGTLSGLALPLQKAAAPGGDYYTQNHFDEGFRVVLPGTTGVEGTYFVRVRSKGGLTSGAYQLQVRVNQRDDLPGSTIRFADIRYATNGIEMYGLPAHSPLTGEASEANPANLVNNSIAGSEFVGNLLASDRNTISVSGNLQSAADVDFFTFEVDYQFIQAIAGVNNGGKSWATIFDIDYADGLSRPDTILSVYDETGNLLFVSRDSDVVNDQPAPGAGQNVNDLSRGSVGKLDPFLGTVALPEGDGKTYYVAVSSNGRMPAELNQTFIANPADPLARLEPVNSLRRIVEDHIGLQGYSTVITSAGATPGFPRILPDLTSGLFDITNATTLSTSVKPFTLADVALYSATVGGNSLSIRNAFTGGAVVNGVGGSDFNDIAMRPDGVLFGTFVNSGSIARVDPLTGAQSGGGASGIPMATGTPDFGGMTFRRTPEGPAGNYELFVVNNNDWDQNGNAADGNEAGSALWRLNPDTGALIDEDTSTLATGNQPVGTLPAGATITGLAFDSTNGSTLFAVDSVGRIWKTTVSGTETSRSIPIVGSWAQVPITGGAGPAGFTGLTRGPQNVQNGAYAQMLFASGSNGRLYAFNQSGVLQSIFDTNNDGVADSTSAAYQAGTRGLAFSPLDFNLWHPTLKRTDDAGHGINEAPDNSRLPDRIYRTINGNLKNESEGGASFYFGLEQWRQNTQSDNAYIPYESGGQLGVRDGNLQRELTSNPAIGNNYNVPGGAYGSLITNSFSLEGYKATDRPVLYFNYFLDTQDANSNNVPNQEKMLDSARVFASPDNGVTWVLIATNNSIRTETADGVSPRSELPAYSSVSATQTPSDPRQVVQELFDNTGSWRQARIDLGQFSGKSSIKLRFDFSTSGKVNDPSVDSLGYGNLSNPDRASDNNHEGFYVDDIIVGLAVRGEMLTTSGSGNQGGSFYAAPADPSLLTQQLVGSYQLEIRRGTEFGSNSDPLTSTFTVQNPLSAKERLVSGYTLIPPAGSGVQDGNTYTISNGIFTRTFEFNLTGGVSGSNIAVAVNAGMSKGQVANALAAAINSQSGAAFNSDSAKWFSVVAATPPASQNEDHVYLTGATNVVSTLNFSYANRLGDQNLERHQGMVIIESNIVRNSAGYGIISDAAPVAAGGQTLAGPVRNLAVLNALRLVAGVTIRNNVVANLGTGGILLSGQTSAANQPAAPVPFSKVINNTIYGGATATGIGIKVEQSSSPTLVNNALVNTVTGIAIDASSSSTVLGSNLFYGNGTNGPTGSDAILPPGGTTLFIDPASNNYYPAPGSPLIDTALNKLPDRPAFTAVRNPLGIPNSDLVAPLIDLYGQIRVDDPTQATPPGLGVDIFKDRGAVERADFNGPFAKFVLPTDDNSSIDLDSGLTRIHLDNQQFPTTLAVDLLDNGIGVDDSKVTSAQFQLRQNGVLLVDNVDYFWRYNPSTNRVYFVSVTSFPTDTRYSVAIENSAATRVRDLAGNALAANQTDGTTVFTLLLTDGVNDPPVNTVPSAQITNEDIPLVFSATNTIPNAIVVSDKDAYLGRPEADPTFTQDDGILNVTLTVTNGTLTLSGLAGLDFAGGFGDGVADATMQFTGNIRDVNAALAGLMFDPAPDFSGSALLSITSNDLGNFGPPPLIPEITTSTVAITINPVNDPPTFTLAGNPAAVNEDAGLRTVANFMTSANPGPANESGQSLLTPQVTVQSVTGNWTTATFFAQAPAIDPVTGTLTYRTAQDVNGTATIQVILTDTGTPGASSVPRTFVITVNPVNDAPVFTVNSGIAPINASGNITTLEDAGVQTVNYVATSSAARATALDEVGGQTPLTWSLSTPTPVSGNLNFTQLSVNPATGVLTYNTVQDTAGSATVVLTLKDSGSGAGSNINQVTRVVTINVTQVNDTPVAATGNYVVDEGYGITLNATGSDVDIALGDTLTYAWDLDNNGTFETSTGSLPSQTFTWAYVSSLGITAPGVRTIRLRVTDSSGAANNSDTVTATLTTLIVDYGDAPNSYGTLKASNGAAHTLPAGGLKLGATVDKEINGQPTGNATGDGSDEDGVAFPISFETVPGQALPAYVDVTASAAGKLDIWLDLNQNGVFDHATEHLNGGVSYSVAAGVNRINFTIPAGTPAGDTSMRFRLSTAGSLLPTGRANDGEVEDYSVKITPLPAAITPVISLPIDFNPTDGNIPQTSDLTPTIAWSQHDANYSYKLVVKNSANVAVFTVNSTPLTSATVPGNLLAGLYTASVTAFNRAGIAATPATWQFQVVPLIVASPAGNVATSRPTINWNAVAGSKTYNVVVESLTTGTIVINQTITTATVVLPALPNQFTPTSDLPLGRYRVRVRATDAADLQGDWSPDVDFTVTTAPVLTAPAASVTGLRPTVSWNPVAGATSYKVTLTFFTDNGVPPVTTTVSGTSWTPATDLLLGAYRVTVQAFNAASESSAVSSVRSFLIQPAPVSSQPLGRVPDTTPTFAWSGVQGADRYELVVSKKWGTFDVVINQTSLTTNFYTQPTALGLGRYTYKIRAVNNPSNSAATQVFSVYSGVYEFVITEPPVITAPALTTFSNHPVISWVNPPNSTTTDIWVDQVGGQSQYLRVNGVSGNSYTPNEKLFGIGTYTVWVRTYSNTDNPATAADERERSDWSVARTFRVSTPPVLVGPVGRTANAQPTLSWKSVPGALNYEVWINNDTVPVGNLFANQNPNPNKGINSLSYTVPEVLPIGQYTFWVRASNSSGVVSNWSLPQKFEVVTPPILTGPSSSTLVARPTFHWTDLTAILDFTPTGAAQYEFRLYEINPSTGSEVELPGFRITDLKTNSHTIPTSLPFGSYRAYVRATGDARTSVADTVTNWSPALNFAVGGGPLVNTIAPTADTTPSLSWQAVNGASGYEVFLSTAAKPYTNLLNSSNNKAIGTTFVVPETLIAGEYKYWVRAFNTTNGAVGSWSGIQSLKIVTLGPPLVNTLAPTTSTTPTLSWQAVNGASGYEVFLGTAAKPNTNLLNAGNNKSASTSFVMPQALAKGEYRYWIRAFNSSSGAVGLWSVAKTLTIADVGNPERKQSLPDSNEFVWTIVPGLVPQSVVSESTISMLSPPSDGPRSLPLTEEISNAKPEVRVLPIESAANAVSTAENTDTTAQTDSILSQWQEHAWWESLPEIAKPGDVRQKVSAAGLFGALLALAPRSLRRRKDE